MMRRSKFKIQARLWLPVLVILMGAGWSCGQEVACKVAVAALKLPANSGGLLHWRTKAEATRPVQLSTRYFSEPTKMSAGVLQFFEAPLEERPSTEPAAPLFSIQIPKGVQLAYVVLWADLDDKGTTKWKGKCFDARDWDGAALKVINACSEPLGILAGRKKIRLTKGGSVVFKATGWKESFPVKIYRPGSGKKADFSSSWRVAAGRSELCFLTEINGRISPRSLLYLPEPPSTDNSVP